jgi:hypothetical protein
MMLCVVSSCCMTAVWVLSAMCQDVTCCRRIRLNSKLTPDTISTKTTPCTHMRCTCTDHLLFILGYTTADTTIAFECAITRYRCSSECCHHHCYYLYLCYSYYDSSTAAAAAAATPVQCSTRCMCVRATVATDVTSM